MLPSDIYFDLPVVKLMRLYELRALTYDIAKTYSKASIKVNRGCSTPF